MIELYLQIFCFCFVFFLFFCLYWRNFLSMQSIFLQRSSLYFGGYPFKDNRRICLLVNTIDTFCVTTGAEGGSRIFLRRVVPDPDLEIREARSFRPPRRGGGGGAVSKKIFFRPFKPHFGLKIRGGGSGPPGPLPWIRYWRGCTTKEWRNCW